MILLRYRPGVAATPAAAPRVGIAFLLAQLGAHAAEEFASALAERGLTPPLVGVLRLLQTEPGLSQQQLSERLGSVPSRVVSYVDELERRGWVVRSRDTVDRRVNVLTVTKAGTEAFEAIAVVARAHEQRITEGLDGADRATLLELLAKLAANQDLTPGVHPGFRRI
jgi:DNA-binding MarR family transcriptional regulator